MMLKLKKRIKILPHSHQLNMFNRTRFNRRNSVQKICGTGFYKRLDLISFNLHALISTKFEVDKNHCAIFDVNTT